jgi:uncharacterized protein YcbK (DUF882 family)
VSSITRFLFYCMTRRHFLSQVFAASVLGLAGSAMAPIEVLAATPKQSKGLWLHHVHTGEELQLSYWEDGKINGQAYGQLCHFMRDFYVNESIHMDIALLNLLNTLQMLLAKERTYQPIMVLSAYRTRATNDRLKGTACNSMHLYGKAIDIYIPGVRTENLAGFGHQLRCGGVGTYLHRGFVHFDTGRVRYWGTAPSTTDHEGDTVVSAQPGRIDPIARFNPQDAKWKHVSRDQLDTMILKWRQRRQRLAHRIQ